jgi:enoyl-CoA hydratase
MTEALRIEDRDGVREITLCRPDMLNAFDDLAHKELTAVLSETTHAASVRAVVLAAEGKVFSAGGDFNLMREAHDDPVYRAETIDHARRLIAALVDMPQPLVTAVQGAAMGLGATVALAGDALVASRNVKLADTHVNIGLVAGDGGCLVWPAAVGMLRARRHLLTGDPLDAETGFRIGAVTDLVDTPEEVLPAARAIAERMAALPPLAVQGTKRALNAVTRARHGEVFEVGAAYEEHTLGSEDLLSAIAAFKEKRPARFEGR